MCLARKHVDFLEVSNERDFRDGKISRQTWEKYGDMALKCRQCDRCDNGQHGDILPDCRTQFLRLFILMKRDAETWRKKQDERNAPVVLLATTSD